MQTYINENICWSKQYYIFISYFRSEICLSANLFNPTVQNGSKSSQSQSTVIVGKAHTEQRSLVSMSFATQSKISHTASWALLLWTRIGKVDNTLQEIESIVTIFVECETVIDSRNVLQTEKKMWTFRKVEIYKTNLVKKLLKLCTLNVFDHWGHPQSVSSGKKKLGVLLT